MTPEWTALGVILSTYVVGGAWLLKSYLPQQRRDFLNTLDRQRQDSIRTLDKVVAQFRDECRIERESHQREVDEVKLEVMGITKEVNELNRQQAKLMAVWISTQNLDSKQVDTFFKKLEEINGRKAQ